MVHLQNLSYCYVMMSMLVLSWDHMDADWVAFAHVVLAKDFFYEVWLINVHLVVGSVSCYV